jgi:hypothetical protein
MIIDVHVIGSIALQWLTVASRPRPGDSAIACFIDVLHICSILLRVIYLLCVLSR